jgi:hypothetical protein
MRACGIAACKSKRSCVRANELEYVKFAGVAVSLAGCFVDPERSN